MSAQHSEAGAYEPRPGDWVTVRRYVKPTTGERTLSSERAGRIAAVQPEADGFLIWLDGDPERIFTGYQFLGPGSNGRGPASLVTEVAPAAHDQLRIPLAPDLALLLDASQCIVAEVTDPAAGGEVLRRVTITNVDAFKAALDDARTAQRVAMDEAGARRLARLDEKRRSQGRLTRLEAVEWLAARGVSRGHAPNLAATLREHPEKPWASPDGEAMTYSGAYWVVPAVTPESGD